MKISITLSNTTNKGWKPRRIWPWGVVIAIITLIFAWLAFTLKDGKRPELAIERINLKL